MTASGELFRPALPEKDKAQPIVNQVSFGAPWHWLEKGWEDLWAAPTVGLTLGALASAGAFSIAAILFVFNALPLLLPLAGGFLLVGPLIAVGMYDVSRCRESGQVPSFKHALSATHESSGRLALFGALLLLLYFFWIRIALLLFMLFFGPNAFPPLPDFIPTLLFTVHGISLLVLGTMTGGILAVLTFAMSAIAVPLIFDRKTDPITASAMSIKTVIANPKAMALWAVLIAAATAAGFATLFLGLIVVFPLPGHATWHAYRELIS